MAPDSMMPASGGSNRKYILIALVLLAAAAGAGFFLMNSTQSEVAPPPVVDVPEEPARSTALAEEPELEIPEEEPEEQPKPKQTERRVASTWDCTGMIDRTKAAQLMQDNRRIVRACYERQLRTDSLLQGTAELTLRINASGSVTGTRISGTLRDPAFRACVKNAASRWKFPPPHSGTCALIAQPFNLTPKTQ